MRGDARQPRRSSKRAARNETFICRVLIWSTGGPLGGKPQSLIDYIMVEDFGGLLDAWGRLAAKALKQARSKK